MRDVNGGEDHMSILAQYAWHKSNDYGSILGVDPYVFKITYTLCDSCMWPRSITDLVKHLEKVVCFHYPLTHKNYRS